MFRKIQKDLVFSYPQDLKALFCAQITQFNKPINHFIEGRAGFTEI